jgi:hypothetical protein
MHISPIGFGILLSTKFFNLAEEGAQPQGNLHLLQGTVTIQKYDWVTLTIFCKC